MILLGHFLRAMGGMLDMLLVFFMILFFARAVLSWVSPDPRNPLVQFINGTTDPILSRIRDKVPPIGMIDISIIIVLALIFFLREFISASMMDYGTRLLQMGTL